jgi:DNA-binding XRE family transcriptional regulator
MKFADKLKKWRGVKGSGRLARGKFSQPKAAAILGVPPRTYEQWESGRHAPSEFVKRMVLATMDMGLPPQPAVRSFIAGAIKIEKTLSEKKGRSALRSRVTKKTKRTRPARRTGSGKSNHEKRKTKRRQL